MAAPGIGHVHVEPPEVARRPEIVGEADGDLDRPARPAPGAVERDRSPAPAPRDGGARRVARGGRDVAERARSRSAIGRVETRATAARPSPTAAAPREPRRVRPAVPAHDEGPELAGDRIPLRRRASRHRRASRRTVADRWSCAGLDGRRMATAVTATTRPRADRSQRRSRTPGATDRPDARRQRDRARPRTRAVANGRRTGSGSIARVASVGSPAGRQRARVGARRDTLTVTVGLVSPLRPSSAGVEKMARNSVDRRQAHATARRCPRRAGRHRSDGDPGRRAERAALELDDPAATGLPPSRSYASRSTTLRSAVRVVVRVRTRSMAGLATASASVSSRGRSSIRSSSVEDVVLALEGRDVAPPEDVHVPAGVGLGPRERLDDGIRVVAVVAVVHVVVEDLDVPELVERDGLGVVAAVRRGRVRLAPAAACPSRRRGPARAATS